LTERRKIMDGLKKCKCGHTPDVYVRKNSAKQKYQGEVECPECMELVKGVCWCWTEDEAAQDAIEEWNKAMPDEAWKRSTDDR
jgi:hypothetical protein